MSRYDVIVIGGGHNGLTTAAVLAKAGRKVLLLERRPVLGGLASEDEFHPGYRSAGLLHDTGAVRPGAVRSLGLEGHGLRWRDQGPDVHVLGDGQAVVLNGNVQETAASIAALSPGDGEAYPRYRRFLDRVRPAVQPLLDDPPLDLIDEPTAQPWTLIQRALRIRRLGRADMMELLRLPTMCVGDWLDEWFESDLLKAGLALPALSGTFLAPRSPGSNANLLLRECALGPGVQGDGPALVHALQAAAVAQGVELRTGAPVSAIRVRDGAACGVVLEDGESIEARAVASSCDPHTTMLKLLPPGSSPSGVERNLRAFRARGTTARVLWAMDRAPVFPAAGGGTPEFLRIAGGLLEIERAFDAAKYRRLPEQPALEVHIPTVSAAGRAPQGHAVVSTLVHFAPRDLEGGWGDEEKDLLGERAAGILERHAPGFSAAVLARKVLSPADLEQEYGLHGGQIHHGEPFLDQILVRPVPGCVGYTTPVAGLFLCGSGSHPGGGLTCAPGTLAAEVMLDRAVAG